MRSILHVLSVLLLCLTLVGCMTASEYIRWTEMNYEIAKINAQLQSKPLIEFEVTSEGKIGAIRANAQPQLLPYLAQKNPNEWVSTVNRVVGLAGWIGGGYILGQTVKDIVSEVGKNAGHNVTTTTTYEGSFNSDRHDVTDTIESSFNGDYRDFGGDATFDNSNRSLNDAYNTDRHDILYSTP